MPYNDNVTALNQLSTLFSRYINGDVTNVTAKGVSTHLANGQTVTWLSTGLQSLNAVIPFSSPIKLDPIKGITIGSLNLAFDGDQPYNPKLSSNALQGAFSLPFGISINITQLKTTLLLYLDGGLVGVVDGPWSNSSTQLLVHSPANVYGNIDLSLGTSVLVLPNTTDEAKIQLVRFLEDATYSDDIQFNIEGQASAVSSTALGEIVLTDIRFQVDTGIKGLSGLKKYDTIVNSVDVVGGTPEAVQLAIQLTAVNPSNINVSLGDLTLDIMNQVKLGSALIPDANLVIGRNDLNASADFDPNRAAIGLETLNRFISGLDTVVDIIGTRESSTLPPLSVALANLQLNSTLPGLLDNIVSSANLTVLDTTGVTDNVANSVVSTKNPFTSALIITRIEANASSHGIYLANTNTKLQFTAQGHATTESPIVPLYLNLNPPDLFGIIRALAIDEGLDPTYIDAISQLAGYTLTQAKTLVTRKRSVQVVEGRKNYKILNKDTSATSVSCIGLKEDDNEPMNHLILVGSDEANIPETLKYVDANTRSHMGMDTGYLDEEGVTPGDSNNYVNESGDYINNATEKDITYPALAISPLQKRSNLFTGFNIVDYVDKAFANAKVDLTLIADVVIGQYGTTLTTSQLSVPLGTDATLLKLLPIMSLPIVQKIVDGAVLNIDRITITEAQDDTFKASIQGALTNSGPFDGVISVLDGLSIYWEGQLLTQAAFPNISIQGDVGALLDVEIQGTIPDPSYFTKFLRNTITSSTFEWTIHGSNVLVDALGISIPNVTLTKSVQLTGLNGLKSQVIINSFDLPSNDAAGGITLDAISTINNPSQIGIALAALDVDIAQNNLTLGEASLSAPLTLGALAVTQVPLKGRLVPQTSDQGLTALSELFTRFVHGQTTPVMVLATSAQAASGTAQWLQEGIKALQVSVSLPSMAFQVIKTISLNQLSLDFTVPSAWSPISGSSNTTASFYLPFSLPVSIANIEGPFTVNYESKDVGLLQIPRSNAQTDVERRIATLTFSQIPLVVSNQARAGFSQFVADTTAKDEVMLSLHGSATAQTDTGAGRVTISNIPFNVDSRLSGLQNLNAKPAIIGKLDVVRGYPTYLYITTTTSLYNPSEISLSASDVSFSALFQDHLVGRASVPGLKLIPGDNKVSTAIYYQPVGQANLQSGQLLLENYIQNVTSAVTVAGDTLSTAIDSLKQALGGIVLNSNLPALDQLIIASTKLEVPSDVAERHGLSSALVTINNPFTASLHILQVQAQAIYQGITIGNINQDLSASRNIISAPGRAVTQSQSIPINLTDDPKTLILFLQAAAAAASVSLGPLPPFLQLVLDMPDTSTVITSVHDPDVPPCHSEGVFDALGAIRDLLKPLEVTLELQTTTKIDEYQTQLNFVQKPVPVITDESALNLVGIVAAPLLQILIDQATLSVSVANATSLTNEGFHLSLQGNLQAKIPVDAYIEFPSPLLVDWQGNNIAKIELSAPLCASPPNGIPNLDAQGQLTILNQDAFSDFTYSLLTQKSFSWTLHSDKVRVRTLGMIFDNVYLSKVVTFDAFDGLGQLSLSNFDAPSDGPGARINIEANTAISSKASLGVELGESYFDVFYQNQNLGIVSTNSLFLLAKSVTSAHINGYLKDQTGSSAGLKALGDLFTNYVGDPGDTSTLTVKGYQVITPSSGGKPVTWLTKAFKRFSTTALLSPQMYTFVHSLDVKDFKAVVLDKSDSYNVLASSSSTVATYSNPFGFHLLPLEAAPTLTFIYNGVRALSIALPNSKVQSATSSGPNDREPLGLSFENIPLHALDKSAFRALFAALADTPSATFGVQGTTSLVAQLAIGAPMIRNVPINVSTTLQGIDSLQRKASVVDANAKYATPDYVAFEVIAQVTNPSNLTFITSDVSVPVRYNSSKTGNNVVVGRGLLENLNIVPGINNLKTIFQLQVINNNTDQGQVIPDYIQPADNLTEHNGMIIPFAFDGGGDPNITPSLSPYESINEALAGLSVFSSLQGIGTRFIKQARVYLTLDVLLEGLLSP